MTLPDSEIQRIKSTYSINDTRANFVAKEEASLWFKRMGEFAEWIKHERWQYKVSDGENHWWYSPIEDKLINTHKLIELFINSLNQKNETGNKG